MDNVLSFSAAYGSHNYKLNRPDSDKDRMYFYYPSFINLYDGTMVKVLDPSSDQKHHDVRKIPQLFYKANVNFLEILYSVSVDRRDSLFTMLLAIRDGISSMNIPYLFDGCMGMYNRCMQNLKRDSEYVHVTMSNDEYKKKNGKHMGSAYRILDFMERYACQEFQDFGRAIAYDHSSEEDQKFIQLYMAMRDGVLAHDEFRSLIAEKEERIIGLKPLFKEQIVNEEVHNLVKKIVYLHVRQHIESELNHSKTTGEDFLATFDSNGGTEK